MSGTEKGAERSEDSPQWEKSTHKFKNKPPSEYFDPCQEFANMSIKCMHRNAHDRDMCSDYFQAYRDCKKAWITEQRVSDRS